MADAGKTTVRSESLPLQPFVQGVALALVVAAILARTLTTGAGQELDAPGAQLLFDALTLCAAFTLVLARVLRGEAPFARAGWPLLALLPVVLVLSVSAARAPHADLAWRTALSWSSIFLLAVTLRDLGRDPGTARLLLALLAACVATGAALALYDYFVEQPALLAEYEAGTFDAELAAHGRGFAIAAEERIRSRAAVGPYVLPALLGAAILAVLPAAVVAARRALAKSGESVAQRTVGALGAVTALIALTLALVLSKSKGAVVSALGLLVVLSLTLPALARHRPRLKPAAAAAAALVALAGAIVWLIGPERIGIGLSFQVRLEYWQAGLGMWSDHPLLGVGLNNFRELFSFYKPPRAEEALHAHNAAVQLLAELGLAGLLAVSSLVFCLARAGARAVTLPGEAGDGAESTSPWTRVSIGAGLALGLLLVAGHGDRYSAMPETLGHLLFIALAVPALTAALAAAFRRPGNPKTLAAAALAGASVLLWDGALDFGLHHAGVLTVTCSLAGLAPALAEAPPEPLGQRRIFTVLGYAAAAVLGVVTLGVLLVRVPVALQADGERDTARTAHGLGIAALREARREPDPELRGARLEEAAAELREAARAYEAATELYPGEVRTWLERSAALDALGQALPGERAALLPQALASAQRAAELDPWAADVWNELGRLRLSSVPLGEPELRRAIADFDEAVARYPTHPTYNLDAAAARVRLQDRLPAGDPQARTLREEARQRLQAATVASETTRLVRLKLSPQQAQQVRDLSRRLDPNK